MVERVRLVKKFELVPNGQGIGNAIVVLAEILFTEFSDQIGTAKRLAMIAYSSAFSLSGDAKPCFQPRLHALASRLRLPISTAIRALLSLSTLCSILPPRAHLTLISAVAPRKPYIMLK